MHPSVSPNPLAVLDDRNKRDREKRDDVARRVAIAWALKSEANMLALLAEKRAAVRERHGGVRAVTATDKRKAVDALHTLTQGALNG